MRVLIVLTSRGHTADPADRTGLWIEEFTAPWYAFRDAGLAITLASPAGGAVPTDPVGDAIAPAPASVARFRADPAARTALAATLPLDAVAGMAFDAIFYPGGLGPMFDLADDPRSIALLEQSLAAGTPTALVCHGQAALVGVRGLAGRRLTAFTRAEDEAAGLIARAPFVLEDRLRALGADFVHGPPDAPFIARDGALLTGQNPASAAPLATALLDALGIRA